MEQTLKTKEYIKRVNAVHNCKYSYKLTHYTNKNGTIKIICPKHGEFSLRASSHLYNGSGCRTCIQEVKYIDQVNVIHNNKYTYNNIGYSNNRSNITITCPEHGDFIRKASYHRNTDGGCTKCVQDIKTIDYIKKANKANNNKYTYEKTKYVEFNTLLTITCPCPSHGDFTKRADSHLKGRGCDKCLDDKAIENFLKKAYKIHGKKFDYSKVKNCKKEDTITIGCPKHGEFSKKVLSHIYEKRGCPKCTKETRDYGNLTTEEFIIKAIVAHGDTYNYNKVVHTNKINKVVIICKIHGEFKQLPQNHLHGRGCPDCGTIRQANKIKFTQEDFLKKAKSTHGDRYDYSKTEYDGMKKKLTIVCKKHGEFIQNAHEHTRGSNCPKCCKNMFSQGQIEWLTYLSKRYKKNIQTALSKKGEFRIAGKIPVDGYCEKTNEIFEFHGIFYHGCPRIYSSNVYNSVCKKTMGELYKRTLEKENMIKKLGYKLVTVWEDEWSDIRKSILKIQRFVRGQNINLKRVDLRKDISHNKLHKLSDKKRIERTCPRCDKVIHSRYDLTRHLKRKTPCSPSQQKPKTIMIRIKPHNTT